MKTVGQLALIVLLCTLAAMVYGVLHDQVTARICVEYFTIGHPPVFNTNSPTLLALGWGVIATWWVGLLLGVALACAARLGSRPKRGAAALLRPIAILFAVTGACAVLAGLFSFALARSGAIVLVDELASQMPPERHTRYLIAGWMHGASYVVGFVGGIILVIQTWRRRHRDRASQ